MLGSYSPFWILFFFFHMLLCLFGVFSQLVFMKTTVWDKKIHFHGRVHLFFLSIGYQLILITFMATTFICLWTVGSFLEVAECKEAKAIPLLLHNFGEFTVVAFLLLINIDRLMLAFRPGKLRGRAAKVFFCVSCLASLVLCVVYTNSLRYEGIRRYIAFFSITLVNVLNMLIEIKLFYYTNVVYLNTIGTVPLERRFELSISIKMIRCFLPASICGVVLRFIALLHLLLIAARNGGTIDSPTSLFVLNTFFNLDGALFPWFFIIFHPGKKVKLKRFLKIRSPAVLQNQYHNRLDHQNQQDHFNRFKDVWKTMLSTFSPFWILFFIVHMLLCLFGVFSQLVFMKTTVWDKTITFHSRVHLFFLSIGYQLILITFMTSAFLCLWTVGTFLEVAECKGARTIPLLLHNFGEFAIVIFLLLINIDRLMLAFRPGNLRGTGAKVFFCVSCLVSLVLCVIYTTSLSYEDIRSYIAFFSITGINVFNLLIEIKLFYYTDFVYKNTIGLVPLERRFELSTSIKLIRCFLPAAICGVILRLLAFLHLFFLALQNGGTIEDDSSSLFVLNMFFNLDGALFPWFFIMFHPSKRKKLKRFLRIGPPPQLQNQYHNRLDHQNQQDHFDRFKDVWKIVLITFMVTTLICIWYGSMFEGQECRQARFIPSMIHNFGEFIVVAHHLLINLDRLMLAFRPNRSRGRTAKVYFYLSCLLSIVLSLFYTNSLHQEGTQRNIAFISITSVNIMNLLIEIKLFHYTNFVYKNTIGLVPLERRFELSTSVTMIRCFLPASICGIFLRFIVFLSFMFAVLRGGTSDLPSFLFVVNLFFNMECVLFPWFFILFHPSNKEKLKRFLNAVPAAQNQYNKKPTLQTQQEHFNQMKAMWKVEK